MLGNVKPAVQCFVRVNNSVVIKNKGSCLANEIAEVERELLDRAPLLRLVTFTLILEYTC